MPNNTTLDAGSGGDTIRTIDKTTYKTPASLIDIGGSSTEALIGDAGNFLPVAGAAAENAAVAGNPVLSGGRYDVSARTLGDGDVGAVALNVSGHVLVSVQSYNTSLPAGTNNIGDVDIVTVPAPLSTQGGGTEATALRVTIANDSTGVLSVDDNGASLTVDGTVTATSSGNVAHDTADSGNPIKIGARAAGTLSNDTMVAEADRTDAVSDLDGAIVVRTQIPLGDLLSERVSNTDGASTAFTTFAAVASTRNYVSTISLVNTSATDGYVDFRDGTAGSVLFTVAIPAGGGAVISGGTHPLFKTTANTALAYDVSAALTTVYISISGFQSKV